MSVESDIKEIATDALVDALEDAKLMAATLSSVGVNTSYAQLNSTNGYKMCIYIDQSQFQSLRNLIAESLLK